MASRRPVQAARDSHQNQHSDADFASLEGCSTRFADWKIAIHATSVYLSKDFSLRVARCIQTAQCCRQISAAA